MIRKIITIDEDKCDGCGLCVSACHEGAIGLRDGKAVLLRDDYCDGLGDCLPSCPTSAISFIEREALPYDDAAVQANIAAKKALEETPKKEVSAPIFGCPGRQSKTLKVSNEEDNSSQTSTIIPRSQLQQWPVQIKLVPINAPYFENANLLVAADCSAFAYGNFHNEFMKNHVTIIGCPKLDEGDYKDKLREIIKNNNIKSLSIVRMEVPCCGGIERAATEALKESGKFIPWKVVTIGIDGTILD